ncbi:MULTISPECIES: efflux transporter outer membrane subunit [Methylomonas]|uniref:efflux transporter outer membrane subunit n=1 Tax=Methylomonas TaxID=416 RepID=UPI0012323CD1|nr:efflux transporter outer membrane subunit [Methylomonas rhizoryzae]
MKPNTLNHPGRICWPALLAVVALAGPIAALLPACAKLGPDFEPPIAEVSQNWLDGNHPALKRGEFRNWWQLFQDPVLDGLIETAYGQNLDLRAAAIRILESRAKLGIAKGQLFPQKQELNLGLFHNQHSGNEPNFTTFDRYYTSFGFGLDALWEVDLWGKFRRGIESSEAMLAVSELDYDDILVSLTAEVAARYTQIRTFEQRLRLAQNNVDLQQGSLRIAEAQYRNGIATELDVQQAKSLLHATKSLLTSLHSGLRQAQNALAVLLGLPPDRLSERLNAPGEIPRAPAEVVVGIPADMVRRRPDIRREEMRAAAQSAMIGVTKADLFPRLSLQGSIGALAGSTQGVDAFDVLGSQAMAAKIGPTITWPILQYGRLKNNVRVQDAKFQEQLAKYRQTVLTALQEAEDAMVGYLKSSEQIGDLSASVDASQRAVTIALSQYQEGIEDYIKVLNAQQFLVQQQDKLTHAQGDVAGYLIALYKALGGGWEIREGRPVLPGELLEQMAQRSDWGELLETGSAAEQ